MPDVDVAAALPLTTTKYGRSWLSGAAAGRLSHAVVDQAIGMMVALGRVSRDLLLPQLQDAVE